jgi:hypothetical protein
MSYLIFGRNVDRTLYGIRAIEYFEPLPARFDPEATFTLLCRDYTTAVRAASALRTFMHPHLFGDFGDWFHSGDSFHVLFNLVRQFQDTFAAPGRALVSYLEMDQTTGSTTAANAVTTAFLSQPLVGFSLILGTQADPITNVTVTPTRTRFDLIG